MATINLDFISIEKKKPVPKRPRNIPKREVRGFDNDFLLIDKNPKPRFTPSFVPRKQAPRREKTNFFIFPSHGVFVRAFGFAMVSLLLIGLVAVPQFYFSVKDTSKEIMGVSTSAYDDLKAAQQSLQDQNFGSATELFTSAENNLKVAQEKLSKFGAVTWLFPPAQSADLVLHGAGLLAKSGEKLTAGLELFNDLKVSSKGFETDGLNDKISQNRRLLSESLDYVVLAEKDFDQASNLPAEYDETLKQARTQVSSLRAILTNLVGLEDLYLSLFGESGKTYLLVFQNHDEIRATGGFIGTYGVLSLGDGKINKLKIDSIYNLDGNIFDQIAAPGPMQPLIKKWGTRDANWFVDFRQSAGKLLQFFEKGQETADGVIAVTPKLFEDLLAITGPISMPAYNVVLTPENFQEVVQFKTSVDYDPVLNQPKKFLADFAPVFLDRLTQLQKEDWLNLFQIFEQGLRGREVMLFSKNPAAQRIIEQTGFSGAILSTDKDYLSIVNTNLGGTKTDIEIKQKAKLESKLLSGGSVMNTLTLRRENPSQNPNKDYIRILVPKGSVLISATGFDDLNFHKSEAEGFVTDPDLAVWDQGEVKFDKVFVRNEADKTEFAGWINLGPASDKTVSLSYILPFHLSAGFFSGSDSYSLLVQKQPGSQPLDFVASLDLDGKKVEWLSSGARQTDFGATFESNSNLDNFWSVIFTQ
jgi:hypothetical protein